MSTRQQIIDKFTVGAATAIRQYQISEHDMQCLLLSAEKNAIDDCGPLASITRKHIESAADILGIAKTGE